MSNNTNEPDTKRQKLDEDEQEMTKLDTPTEKTTENTIEESHHLTENNDNIPNLSKRQQKKLLKLAKWETVKLEKRQQEREKYRQRRIAAVGSGLPKLGPSRKELKYNKMADSKNPHTIAVDLEFDDLMIDKDICKCVKQLLWVYTINRKAQMPLHVYYTGIKEGGKIQKSLDRNDGYKNWDINIRTESYLDCFDKERIVYLTSDSDTVLTELDQNDVYIIGGLVDHNHHKGLSLSRAEERGIRTARLPLSEHISIKTRTVLTIVHVFDILLRVSEGKSWQDALLGVLPSRKGAKPKDEKTASENVLEPKEEIEIDSLKTVNEEIHCDVSTADGSAS